MRQFLCAVTALVVVGVLAGSPAVAQEATPADCPTLSRDETAEVARQHLDVWNSKDLSLFDSITHPDVVYHWGQDINTNGLDELKTNASAYFEAYPDITFTFEDVIVEGNMVVIRWTATGTQAGQFFHVEPTGNSEEWTGVNIYRIECGQVVESWSEYTRQPSSQS